MKCPQVRKENFVKFFIKNPIKTEFLKNKKILVIRPDRLWDLMVTFPLVYYLSKNSYNIDRWIDKKYNQLISKLLSIYNIENVNLKNYDLKNRNAFFWYEQEKHDKLLRLKLGLKFLFSKDFFGILKLFKDYDIVIDLVWKRRFQINMFLSKTLKSKKVIWVNRSLTDRILDSVIYRGDLAHITDQYLSLFEDIDLKKFKEEFNNINQTQIQDYILIHIWYGWENSRNWGVDNRSKLIEYLLEKNKNIKLVYTDVEKQVWDKLKYRFRNKIEIIQNPSFDQFFDLINLAKYFIWIDSGPFHLADILGKKWIVLFSRENEKVWWPWLDNIQVIKKYDWVCLMRNCEFDYCMKLIKLEDVIEKLNI